jgi:drug/metabolite transporter (DMT)-like permease
MVWFVYVLGVLIFGSTWVAMKIGLQAMPPFTAAVARSILAFVIFFLIFRLWRFRFPKTPNVRRDFFLAALMLYGVSFALLYWGQERINASMSAILYATMPLFTAILAHFMIPKERLTARVLIGLLIGIAGTVVLFAGNLSLSGKVTGMVAMVLSSGCCAWATVKTKRDLGDVNPAALAIMQIPVGLIVLLPALAVFETPVQWLIDARGAGSIIYLAILGTGIGFIIWFYLLKHLSAVAASTMTLIEPVVASLLSYLILSESFDDYFFAGSALILAGVLVATMRRSELPCT